ncbi:MAG TPA: autotransporter-associated beta strand repeat-containing protein, partial [Tepidisphaeraceae bacterium]|nr:autotransporter-associated beta strand repeat-containing protein [Tepidisphaeraceae bacterium]
LNSNTTLGTLDFDDAFGVSIGSAGAILNFDTQAGNAVLFARNVNGNGFHSIFAQTNLSQTLEVINDSKGALSFDSVVSGSGGIIKTGLGTLILDGSTGPNTYSGATLVQQGYVDLNKAGAIAGGGPVLVSNGVINYNVNGAITGGVQAQVNSNGEVNLGVVPTGGDLFAVNGGGAVRGDATELAGLTIGGNLALATGGMIVHESFDTGATGNPGGLFAGPIVPSQIFGIGTDFTAGSHAIIFGSNSGTPWIGFGGDHGVRTYGSGVSDTNNTLLVDGNGKLVSLGGMLAINGQLNGTAGSTLTKNGAGVVAINNVTNGFHGPIDVQEGALAINGVLTTTGIDVQEGTTLGGKGIINGPVVLHHAPTGNGGHLSPGAISAGHFEPPPFTTDPDAIGTLTLDSLEVQFDAQLDFDLNTPDIVGGGINDLAVVNNALILDGFLNIFDGPDFGIGTYTLLKFGSITDLGLQMGDVPPDYLYNVVIVPAPPAGLGSVLLNVSAIPEPSAIALIGFAAVALSRKRRSSRTRTLH